MACPLFVPQARMPLSDLWSGLCAGDPRAELPEDLLTRCCNRGYARGECARAAGAEADSLRFMVRSGDAAEAEVMWASERDHLPLAVGVMRVARTATAAAPLEAQALACAAGYWEQTGEL